MVRSVVPLLLLLLAVSGVWCKKNVKEEAICQPFLTSRATSPLIPTLRRNVTYDEDGEFACELVLQDEDLPVQIRATIHEGLGWLAIRHVQMGLVRQSVVARHFSLLSELSSSNFDFAYKAGMFYLEPSVSHTEKALKYLERALKNAPTSKATAEQLHNLRHLYVKALRRVQRHDEAENELRNLLADFPYDFETQAILKHNSAHNAENNIDFDFLDRLYADIQAHADSEYAGFRPACADEATAWHPTVYSRILSETEFAEHVNHREPFIVRLGSAKELNTALGWNIQAWKGEAGKIYLRQAVGEEELVLVESRAHKASTPSSGGDNFGFGLSVHRKMLSFDHVLANDFTNEYKNESLYINIQEPPTSGEVYRTPLHLLKQDIPPPSMLNPVWSNITEVNLWMGIARDRDAQSNMHLDATDNLYVMLEGQKHFSVISPADALKVRTLSPTYAVSPDGMSFQFNMLKFREYARAKAREAAMASQTSIDLTGESAPLRANGTRLESSSVTTSTSSAKCAALDNVAFQTKLLNNEVEYDVSNFHFSALPASAYPEVNCGSGPNNFDLLEGDMLYLPTGWLHQVTSKQGRHMAVNYWWRALNWRDAVQYEREKSEALYDKLLE
eukprot:gene23966-27119_t